MSTLVRTVALLHTPEVGAVHVDWMWSPGPGLPDADARVLTTFRLPDVPLACGERFDALRIPDHRARYLWFEGEIGRGLGRVERLWAGVGRLVDQAPDRFDIELSDGLRLVRVAGRADPGQNSSSHATIFRCTAQRVGAGRIGALGPLIPGE